MDFFDRIKARFASTRPTVPSSIGDDMKQYLARLTNQLYDESARAISDLNTSNKAMGLVVGQLRNEWAAWQKTAPQNSVPSPETLSEDHLTQRIKEMREMITKLMNLEGEFQHVCDPDEYNNAAITTAIVMQTRTALALEQMARGITAMAADLLDHSKVSKGTHPS